MQINAELIKDDIYCIPGHVNTGLVINGKNAIIIDTGLDESSAKKILGVINKAGLNLQAILNTHSHADHYGGNYYILERNSCEVFVPEFEEVIVRNPLIEPIYLYGAIPFKEIKGKFFFARASRVDRIVKGDFSIDGVEIKVVDIPGHSPYQKGYVINGVFFCADLVFSTEIINKYKILYCYDPQGWIESLEKIEARSMDFYVPAHARPCININELIDANATHLRSLQEKIVCLIKKPLSTEDITAEISRNYGEEGTIEGYFLRYSAIKAHLSALRNRNLITCFVYSNRLVWQVV